MRSLRKTTVANYDRCTTIARIDKSVAGETCAVEARFPFLLFFVDTTCTPVNCENIGPVVENVRVRVYA